MWRPAVAAALIVGGAVCGSAHAGFETPVAITNTTIVTGRGPTIDAGTILIAEGRIVAAGADVEIPAHAERVDGTGLIAYPGFIDAHTHLGVPEAARTEAERLRAEDTRPDPREGPLSATSGANRRGVRPEARAVELYAPDEKDVEKRRALGFTTAVIAPRYGIFAGTSDLLILSGEPVRRSVLASGLAMHGSFKTGEEGGYPRSLLGVIAQFRQALLDAQRHVKLLKYAERHPLTGPRPVSDPALDALQPLLRGSQRIVFEANSAREIVRALDLTREFNLNVVISGGKEAYKVADRLKAEGVAVIVSLKFDEEPAHGRKEKTKPGSEDPHPEPTGAARAEERSPDPDTETKAGHGGDEKGAAKYEPLELRRERRRLWEEEVNNILRLHEAGIPFALRTRDFKDPCELLTNLRKVIQRGLPEEAALAALTTTPASLFHMENQIGSIGRSRLANLTLMTKPLGDEKAKVKLVFIGGKKFEFEVDEKKKDAKKKGDDSEVATDSAKATEDDKSDEGPTWAVEIEADRVPKTRTGGDVLIQNATIIPVTSPTIANGSIFVRDGKIAELGPDIAAPEGVTVIDATGRFVMPGFVDAHSHLGMDSTNESSVAISAEVRVADAINPTSVGIYRAVAGGTTTHLVLHGSANPIGGQNAVLKLKYGRDASEMWVDDAPRTIKFATGENVTNANFHRAWGKRYPSTRMGVEAVYRDALESARSYQKEWSGYQRRSREGEDLPVPRRDLRLAALAEVLDGTLTVHAHCYRTEEILRLIGVAEEYGFRLGTLQHVLEGYRIAPELARHGCGASTFSNMWAYKIEAYGAIPHNAAMMSRYGICSSVNSDSPNTIRYLGQEAAKSIRWGGLDEIEALSLVTINSARQLQIEDRIGSLEVGKDGDIAIFNGHPLNTFSKCVMTLIEGEVYFEDARPEAIEPCDVLRLPTTVDSTIPQTLHRAYAIVGATVHPISGPIIADGKVVIVDDLVHAVGSDVELPPGCGVIDGAGLHVYPGLIDAGSTIGLTEIGSLRSTRDNREMGTFNPHVRAISAVHPHSQHVRIARTGGTTTALTKPSGGRIAGQSAIVHLDGWTVPEMVVVDAFGLHMTVPSLPVHLSTDKERRKKQKAGHEEAAKKLDEFMAKAKHYAKVKALAAADPAIECDTDLTLDAMAPYVRGDKPVLFGANAYKQMLDTIEFAEEHELRCVISGGKEAWKLADVLADKHIPVILGTPLSYPGGKFEPWDSVYRCAAVLDGAGVAFCFASESASDAYNLGIQAGMAVAHGLPKERAEYALTLGAARILGIDDRVGSIEPGKRADLIVITDSPLQTSSVVTHMFINGTPVELTSAQTESYEKFKNRPTPSLPPAPELNGPESLTRP